MSLFDQQNTGARFGHESLKDYGPTAGFFDAYNLAYESHVRTSAQNALESALAEEDDAQAVKWGTREDGSRAPRLSGVAPFQKLAKYFVDGTPMSPSEMTALQKYDEAVARASERGVEVVPARNLFESVQSKAQRAEEAYDRTPFSLLGQVGGLFGGTFASVDPRTDPLNFATLSVGAAGKTALQRIFSQVGGQAAIETVNQAGGVQENRRLLGLSHGIGEAALDIAAVGLGAGVLQGVGEGAVAGARRWFGSPSKPAPGDAPVPDMEEPPTPPAPAANRRQSVRERGVASEVLRRQQYAETPWAGVPRGSQRTDWDIEAVERQLAPWGSPPASRVSARAATAVGRTFDTSPEIKPRRSTPESIDTTARQLDPELFTKFDKLQDRAAQLRAGIDALAERNRRTVGDVERNDIVSDIEVLKRRRQRAKSSRKAKILSKRIEALESMLDAKAPRESADTPAMRKLREALVRTDEQMRDLAPLITRAYARSRDEWSLRDELADSVDRMIDTGAKRLPEERIYLPDFEAVPEPTTAVSPLARATNTAADAGESAEGFADAADAMSFKIQNEAETLDVATDSFIAAVRGIDDEATEVELEGVERPVQLDQDRVVVEVDGESVEMSVRDMFNMLKEDAAELAAMQSCSIAKIS